MKGPLKRWASGWRGVMRGVSPAGAAPPLQGASLQTSLVQAQPSGHRSRAKSRGVPRFLQSQLLPLICEKQQQPWRSVG